MAQRPRTANLLIQPNVFNSPSAVILEGNIGETFIDGFEAQVCRVSLMVTKGASEQVMSRIMIACC